MFATSFLGRLVIASLFGAACTHAVHAELRILEPMVNLGQVRGGAPVTHHFHFVNDGPEAVELLEARTSCGCLSPRLARGTLTAGAEGRLPVFIRSLGQPAGPHTWTAQLRYRLGQVEKEASLQVTADILNEITIQPASLMLFTSAGLAQDLMLTDCRPQPLTVVAVRSSNHSLKAELVSQEGGTIRLRVAATEAFSPGRHDETLSVYTNDPLYRHLPVPVTVVKELRRRVTAIPEAVTWSLQPGQDPAPVMVRLRGRTGEAIEIDKVQADDPAISCRWAAGDGSWATVRIQVDQTRLTADKLSSQVRIWLRRPADECLVIPVVLEKEP